MSETFEGLSLTASDQAQVASLTIETTILEASVAKRQIIGRVCTYGELGNTNLGPTRFLKGSLAAADPSRVKLLLEHDTKNVLGYATAIEERGEEVWATFQVAAGAAGDDLLTQAAAKTRDGLSVGVNVVTGQRAADGALEVQASVWRETSVVGIPAFISAQAVSVAASQPQFLPTAFAGQFAGQQIAAGFVPSTQQFSVGSSGSRQGRTAGEVGDMLAAAYLADGAEGLNGALRAALSDIVPPVGEAAGRDVWFPKTWLGEIWTATKVDRPIIDMIGSPQGLRSMRLQGFRKVRPGLNVAPYAGGKAAIPTGGNVVLEVVDTMAQRFAGGHDVDRAFIDFGDGEFIRAYFQIQTENYLTATETWTAAQLLADATPFTTAPTSLIEALSGAALQLSQIGASLDAVKVGPGLWAEALGITSMDAPWLLGGSADVKGGTATIANIKFSVEPSFAATQFLGLDRRAATFSEWKNPPLKVQAENIPQGGIDLAVFGYAAYLTNDDRAIVGGLVL